MKLSFEEITTSKMIEKVIQQKSTQLITNIDKGAMKIPASWYIAMNSKKLGKKPILVELFGKLLVAWRDQNSCPVIMESYCSHLGASLAAGQVVDGYIQCPFHHWRYDSSGQCVSSPEVEHVPSTARQATYVATERYGYIWVWYGSQTPLFPLPEFPSAENEKQRYSKPLRFAYNTKTTVQRLAESAYDYYHVTTLHGQKVSEPIRFTLVDDQYTAQQSKPPIQTEACFKALIEYSLQRYDVKQLNLIAQSLGFSAQTFASHIDGWPSGCSVTNLMDGEERFKLLFCTTPVTENMTIAHYLVTLKKTGKFWLDILYFLLLGWQIKMVIGTEDIPVLSDLKSDGGGAYVRHDRGILKFREFYQRWVNKAS
jgi:nitrite reductase/ring-hydroxylating ferredoxin subunit